MNSQILYKIIINFSNANIKIEEPTVAYSYGSGITNKRSSAKANTNTTILLKNIKKTFTDFHTHFSKYIVLYRTEKI